MNKLIIVTKNALRSFAGPAFNFLIIVLGVKTFGKTEWASLIDIMLWVFFATFIFSLGNYDYLLRKYSKNPATIYSSFFSNFFTRSLLLLLSFTLFFFFPFTIALWSIVLTVLVFCYSSLNTLVVYDQEFSAQLIAETLAFLIIIGSIFYFDAFNLVLFLKIYCIAITIKLLYLIWRLQLWKKDFKLEISFKEIKYGIPFFILGLSGWLISKVDIYMVDFYLEKSQLAEYQILITAFLMLQAMSAYIIIPFTKHIYRLPQEVVQKMKYKLYILAIPLIIFGVLSIWFVMEYFVELGFSYYYYIVGGFIALPCYFYTLNIMELIKSQKERIVISISFFGFFINLILILLLIESYQVLGVLWSVCITQWVVLICFKYYSKHALK